MDYEEGVVTALVTVTAVSYSFMVMAAILLPSWIF